MVRATSIFSAARWLSSGLPSFLLGNPIYLLVAAAVIFAAGSYSGWTVNGWRLGTQLEAEKREVTRLSAENAILRSANERCGVDVKAVQGAVAGIMAEAKALADEAREAMQAAAGAAGLHMKRAEALLNRPPVPPAERCATIEKEQLEYLQLRRADRLGGKP